MREGFREEASNLDIGLLASDQPPKGRALQFQERRTRRDGVASDR